MWVSPIFRQTQMLIHQTLKFQAVILWIPAGVEAFRFHAGAKWWYPWGRLVGTPGIRWKEKKPGHDVCFT